MMRYYKSDLFVTICVVYLDDILIFSVSLEEHLQALDKVKAAWIHYSTEQMHIFEEGLC